MTGGLGKTLHYFFPFVVVSIQSGQRFLYKVIPAQALHIEKPQQLKIKAN